MNKCSTKQRLAIFASGAGSNAMQLITHFSTHTTISIELVVCNKPDAGVVNIAKQYNIDVLMIDKKKFDADGYLKEILAKGINFIVLAGFLWKIPEILIKDFKKKIVNIHPALLPKYGGKGMYGQQVHNSVIEAGEKESGITIHWVDGQYDHGKVIFQVSCPVLKDDTATTLSKRIHTLEHQYYPLIVEKVLMQKK